MSESTEPWVRPGWHLIEHVNAVSYFGTECREAGKALGLPGCWMGYFAFRAAPFEAVLAPVVAATFYNFQPAMVAKYIPDAWTNAAPADVLVARQSSAAAALRRVVPDIESLAPPIVAELEPLVAAASPA